jgi:nucleoside phosphorylase
MRENFFLHFLNRDSREIFGLYRFQNDHSHYRLLRRALNASVLLCENFCIMPPGFVIEDEIAFSLAESQRAFLESRILQFPIRESSLSEYAEKKRAEYYPMRNRYSGLFDDSRLEFLGRNAQGLIHRKAHISEGILAGWQQGADTEKRIWSSIRKDVDAKVIREIQQIPRDLHEEGTALTWSAIGPKLPIGAQRSSADLRNVLQYTYFKQYCAEFGLIVLSAIPYMIEEFYLPRKANVYSYKRFSEYLDCFELTQILLEGRASFLMRVKKMPGFVSFVDAYAQFAEFCKTDTDLTFQASIVAGESKFDWPSFAKRHRSLIQEPSDLESLELEHAFKQTADRFTERFGLEKRALSGKDPNKKTSSSKIEVISMPDIVIFVALDEELEVLAKELNLKRSHLSPSATGVVGGTSIDVISPKEMGRVPAAVETAKYLESHRKALPSLIIIVGLAGGFPEQKSDRGHIICATTVVDLANRKVVDEESGTSSTKFRRRDFNLAQALQNVLSSEAFGMKEWSDSIIEDWPKDRRPSVHYGPLASVDEVVSSLDWRRKLLSAHDKLLGVEMEAGGVCAAAEKYGVKVCMLRAVSDNADPSKGDDKWRTIGMKALARLLAKLPFEAVKAALAA